MTRLTNSTRRDGLLAGQVFLCLSLIAVFPTLPAQAQTLTTLHTFAGQMDGGAPEGLVAVDRAANVYGSSPDGGSYRGGAVFRAGSKNGSWTLTPIYDFHRGQDGSDPLAGVTLGPDGAIYGTTL